MRYKLLSFFLLAIILVCVQSDITYAKKKKAGKSCETKSTTLQVSGKAKVHTVLGAAKGQEMARKAAEVHAKKNCIEKAALVCASGCMKQGEPTVRLSEQNASVDNGEMTLTATCDVSLDCVSK